MRGNPIQLRENYDNDFKQFLVFNRLYSIAKRLGYRSAKKAWEANPRYTIDLVNNKVSQIGDDDYIELRKAIFERLLKEEVISQDDVAMTILSTTSDKDDDLLKVLDELAGFTSKLVLNPNNKNNIKMWVLYTN